MYEYPKDNRIKSPKGKAKGEKEKTPVFYIICYYSSINAWYLVIGCLIFIRASK